MTEAPEFQVLIDTPRRAAVYFRGVRIRNVRSVEVTAKLDIDDVLRSTITIELVGEMIPVAPLTDLDPR